MASDRSVYHVVPKADGSRWVVSKEDSDGFREEYDTRRKPSRQQNRGRARKSRRK